MIGTKQADNNWAGGPWCVRPESGEHIMRIARYRHKNQIHHGIVEEDSLRVLESNGLTDLTPSSHRVAMAEVTLLPPASPSKIVCVGQNYREHILELGVPVPKEPVIFLKPPSCLIAHGESIVYPPMARRVDYEGELAIVVKEKMSHVSRDEALRCVLGYSCFNDVTERELAAKNPFLLTLAKSFDTFGPFGPYIVTDLDPDNLELKTYLNGRLMQHDSTTNCVFDARTVLSFISRYITLYPGDVVITGTPKGVAPIKPGDQVEVEIEGIGRLSNDVVSAH
jgi:2-keto-4-pentenoate hydratase/2-oxohepta-3-ene-1,7-dioic acid hydratase in catechol pathway